MTNPAMQADGVGVCARVAQGFISRAEKAEPTLSAFTQIDAARLLREAAALDDVAPSARGPLHGLLVAVKEVYDVAGYTCGWGTPIHANRVPKSDAAAVAKLRAAGALIAGITVSTEYAISRAGPTVNPFDPARSPGASSQGSAAAVGSGLVRAALGSQTIGSIIRPSAYCGCIGFKPTWGSIDDAGAMPLSAPIDHPGVLTADPETAARLFAVLSGTAILAAPPSSETVIIEPWFGAAPSPAIIDAIDAAARRLCGRSGAPGRIAVPEWIAKTEGKLIDTILAYGMAANHGGDFDADAAQMSPRVVDYITRGRAISDSAYQDALGAKGRIAEAMDDLLGDAVGITAPTLDIAPLRSEGTGRREPQRLWSLTGQPAISIPFGRDRGMPIGIQIVARRGNDTAVMAAGAAAFTAR